tara:strand:- start:10946 stop:11776 length:831 start_codon:yes stop_codon:yes gene_type:complete
MLARISLALLLLPITFSPSSGEEVRGRVQPGQSSNEIELVLSDTEIIGPLQIGPGDAAINYEGKEIVGDLTTVGDAPFLRGIWPDNELKRNAMAGVNRSLIRQSASLGRSDTLTRGDYLPDFALYNQWGAAVFSSQLRKSPTVLTFLFTRCADPMMCPATAARLADLGRTFADRGWDDVQLVAVSFDPENDTPGVLNQYGEATGMDTPAFQLLTGDPEAIEALLRVTGVRTLDQDGTIVHNLVTLLTDDHGRVILRQDGSRWSAEAIEARLESTRK